MTFSAKTQWMRLFQFRWKGGNNIEKIRQLEFRAFKTIEILRMEDNKIEIVEPSAFVSFKNITLLDLTMNKIKSFPNKLFLPMDKLERHELLKGVQATTVKK